MVNDLDRGAYISNTLRIADQDPAGGAGRDLPDDASGRAADQGRGAQNLFHNLFFTFERYDLSASAA